MKLSALGLASQVLPAASASQQRRAAATQRRLPWSHDGETLQLAITRQPARGPAVLWVHGATFPSALSAGWRMDGVSWLDQLQATGLDAWAFDFAGYGGSDRPAVFGREAGSAPPYGQCQAAASQIAAVLQAIRHERPTAPIHVVAHSWGTLPARQLAIDRPELVARLVLFGPVTMRNGEPDPAATPAPAWTLMTAAQQRPRQRSGMPGHLPTPVGDEELERWCTAYLDSDPTSHRRTPRSAKIPGGPGADIGRLWAGETLVDDGRVRQPTLIVRGEWDHVTTDADAASLFAALTHAADKRDVKIAGGNHWLHLQPQRRALWAETLSFLREAAAS
ncbi:alpha/beta hydrolase [Luteimonas salinilitoris]|uniref:Alpha/beta hydrolase n=1 Tax=Luteimonas salinilitoris TaxID=3237697 RepID=A0ABV4HS03_9GAMM